MTAEGWRDDLSRPLAKYLLYYPLILAAAAVFLWVEPSDKVTAVCSAVGTVVGLVVLWDILFTANVIRLTRVCSTGLILGYGTGTLYSWLTDPRGGYPLAMAVGLTVPVLARGVAAALMGSAVLLASGELLERPVATRAKTLIIDREIKRLIPVGLGTIAAAFATGRFVRGGVTLSSPGHAGILNEFLLFLLYPTLILTTVAFLVERSPRQKLLLGLGTALILVLGLTQGRGPLIYSALTVILLARFCGYHWENFNFKKILLLCSALLFLVLGVLAYQLLRVAGGVTGHTTLVQEAETVIHWEKQGRAWKMATTSTANNLHTRGLISAFLSSLLYQTTISSPAHGRDLSIQLQEAVPSLLYPNKPTIQEEGIASQAFHQFYPDQPNSLFTAGAVDFGVWGVMVYPALVILGLSFVMNMTKVYMSHALYLFGLALMVVRVFGPEQTVTGYVVVVKNFLAFALFLYLISKVPSVRLNRDVSDRVYRSQ